MSAHGSLGHLYPKIIQDSCIDCGLCQKSCPALNPLEQIKPGTAYAAWSKDEEDYKTSTSGGAASVLSQYVLAQGGVVYGCAMLPDIEVKHIRIDSIDDIKKLKGSKYVQSSIVDIIPSLKTDVKVGRNTLFIGTPCQVAAIKKLFKEQPENLLLVDLICHGVPSVSILKKHVHKVANYSCYDNIIFREGTGICVVVVVDGQIVYRQPLKSPRYKDWYINTFIDGYTYRDSCYKCRYACPERVSDITIGDFWGLGKHNPADDIPPHPNGCSVILPTTGKGLKVVNAISEEMNIFKRDVEEAVSGNDQLKFPSPYNRRKKIFRKLYPFLGRPAYKLVIFDKYTRYQLKRVKNKLSKLIKR